MTKDTEFAWVKPVDWGAEAQEPKPQYIPKCGNWVTMLSHVIGKRRFQFFCGNFRLCPTCRGLKIDEELANLGVSQNLHVLVVAQDRVQAVTKALSPSRANIRYRRFPQNDGSTIFFLESAYKDASPAFPTKAYMDNVLQEVPVGQRISGKLKVVVDEGAHVKDQDTVSIRMAAYDIQNISYDDEVLATEEAMDAIVQEPVPDTAEELQEQQHRYEALFERAVVRRGGKIEKVSARYASVRLSQIKEDISSCLKRTKAHADEIRAKRALIEQALSITFDNSIL